jgi:SAM-dependent methyltransferase
MSIKKMKDHWDAFGRNDPMWAILSEPEKKGKRWESVAFFKTGVTEIDALIAYLESLEVGLARRRALDFGCGIGRLTQALADHFDEVHGVDLAPSMIELANRYNRRPDKCQYHLNEDPLLRTFPSDTFDLVYSNLTLQHIEPKHSRKYISEFIRVLATGGVLVFQLPSHPVPIDSLKELVKRILPEHLVTFLRRIKNFNKPLMYMYGINKKEVADLLRQSGVRVLDVLPDHSAGKEWVSFRYSVLKEGAPRKLAQ